MAAGYPHADISYRYIGCIFSINHSNAELLSSVFGVTNDPFTHSTGNALPHSKNFKRVFLGNLRNHNTYLGGADFYTRSILFSLFEHPSPLNNTLVHRPAPPLTLWPGVERDSLF